MRTYPPFEDSRAWWDWAEAHEIDLYEMRRDEFLQRQREHDAELCGEVLDD